MTSNGPRSARDTSNRRVHAACCVRMLSSRHRSGELHAGWRLRSYSLHAGASVIGKVNTAGNSRLLPEMALGRSARDTPHTDDDDECHDHDHDGDDTCCDQRGGPWTRLPVSDTRGIRDISS